MCKDTIYDDSKGSPGQKFALQDLIGVPLQIRIGRKSISSQTLEIKTRAEGKIERVPKEDLLEYISRNNIV